MTQERDPKIQELLAAANPAPEAAAYENWNAVLERAETSRRKLRVRFPRVSKRTGGGGLIFAAAAVFAAALLWPSAGKHSVLDRALAVVGDRPIIHVTYRVKQNYAFVDLRTGRRTLVFAQHEEWLDPSGALRSAYKDGTGHLHVTVLAPGKGTLSGHQRETYSGILDGYRKALENGSATLSAKTRFRGRDIYWVRFKGQRMLNVSGHKSRYQDWALEVAIDATTFRPVYLYETINGRPQAVTGQEIVSVETLPSGSVDFTPTPQHQPEVVVLGGSVQKPIDLEKVTSTDAPARALGAEPLWLGRSYRNKKFAYLNAGTVTWGSIKSPHHTPAVELCYGMKTVTVVRRYRGVVMNRAISCEPRNAHVLLQETTEPTASFRWPVGLTGNTDLQIKIPEGSAMIYPGGSESYVVERGIYVHIDAGSEAAAIEAARALKPLGSGSGKP
ncbi:MAG: hypothetical protein WBQ14_04655 [Gaiellaceae bacterium]